MTTQRLTYKKTISNGLPRLQLFLLSIFFCSLAFRVRATEAATFRWSSPDFAHSSLASSTSTVSFFKTASNACHRCQSTFQVDSDATRLLKEQSKLLELRGGGDRHRDNRQLLSSSSSSSQPLRGGGIIPAGWNPFGYKVSALGLQYLEFEGSLDGDVGRFLASLKSERKTFATLKSQWLEIVRVSKTGQSMRIYRRLQELIDFCLKSGLID